jgi:hypothetical protein
VVGEDEQASKSETPRLKENETAEAVSNNEKGKEEDATADEKAASPPELPEEVQTRLRKLEKLEPKYTGEWCGMYSAFLA